MSCGACTRSYGFFCKESGCPNCGFSFCTKCLKKEIEVPGSCGGSKLKVCLRCFEKFEKEKFMKSDRIIKNAADVLAVNEPIESLAAPLEPIHLQPGGLEEIDDDDNDDEEDNEIADNLDNVISKRLNKLRTDGAKALPNDSEMAVRLSSLKGIPHKEYSNKNILLSTDKRTEKERIDDLLKQFVEEKSIDEQISLDPVADIERRLAILKGQPLASRSAESMPVSKEDDDDVAIRKVLEQFLEETKLPGALLSDEEKELVSNLPAPSKDTEELPWCTICNEDASVRCLGCDGDLFCAACFRECHDDDDFREHKSQTYQKPTSFKENHF